IEVNSEVDKGTCFNIWLPCETDNSTLENEEEKVHEKFNGEGLTILIVDDEALILETTTAFLNDHGCETLCAHNGVDAVEVYKVHQEKIDLIIMDSVMPEMTGEEATEKIKEICPTQKILMASGQRAPSHTGHENPADYALSKPYAMEEINIILRDIINS
ncbi:MAG: response regulator, partial [Planctomycetes bacterium]|nr:response regulator [Planctomycetota bacterium]